MITFQPTLEGALALASLPAPPPAEQLTPQIRMERAKQAERAHLLQICMELGVEIYDVRFSALLLTSLSLYPDRKEKRLTRGRFPTPSYVVRSHRTVTVCTLL